jgi:hypothetical protein
VIAEYKSVVNNVYRQLRLSVVNNVYRQLRLRRRAAGDERKQNIVYTIYTLLQHAECCICIVYVVYYAVLITRLRQCGYMRCISYALLITRLRRCGAGRFLPEYNPVINNVRTTGTSRTHPCNQ